MKPRKKKQKKSPPKSDCAIREIALGLLARREHSRRELVLKLRKRGCPEETLQEVIDKLTEEGMQSDPRFAEAFVRNRVDRGTGPLRIKAEMLTRGLDDEIMEVSLEQYKDWWKDLALEVYQKRYGEKPVADYEEKAKRMAFLQSRGFTAEQIRYAVDASQQSKQSATEA